MADASQTELSLEEKNRKLEEENRKLKRKIERLQKTMEITTRHSDAVAGELEEKMEASVREIEERVRLISETIPVPILISSLSDGHIRYVNEHACRTFGFSPDEFITHCTFELCERPEDARFFKQTLSERDRVHNVEIIMKKKDGEPLWVELFSQTLKFKNEPCILTVIYDLTYRKKTEEEIRRLKEMIEQKESKYLMVVLDGIEFGINMTTIREIIRLMPITAVPNMPEFVKGVIDLRGRVVPIIDLRLALGLKAVCTDRTCIVIVENKGSADHALIGVIVDSVIEVLNIRNKDIEMPSEFGRRIDTRLIVGMAKVGDSVKPILNVSVTLT